MSETSTARAKRARWSNWGAVLIIGVLVAMVATELTVSCLRRFWVDHPVFAAAAVGVVFILLTIFVVQRLLERQEERRSSSVAATGLSDLLREAAEAQFAVVNVLRWPGGA